MAVRQSHVGSGHHCLAPTGGQPLQSGHRWASVGPVRTTAGVPLEPAPASPPTGAAGATTPVRGARGVSSTRRLSDAADRNWLRSQEIWLTPPWTPQNHPALRSISARTFRARRPHHMANPPARTIPPQSTILAKRSRKLSVASLDVRASSLESRSRSGSGCGSAASASDPPRPGGTSPRAQGAGGTESSDCG